MDDILPEIHKCGTCEAEFDSEKGYLNHTCEASGFRPTNPKHLVNTTTPEFEAVSDAALRRGEEKVQE